MKKYTINDNRGNKKIIYANNLSHAIALNDYKVQDIDVSSLMTLFTKYGKPYGYACKKRPNMSSSASKYTGQLVAYTLSPIGKYDIHKAREFVDFLERKGYEASIFAPNIIVTLKQDRSSGFYKSGHEKASQYDSVRDIDIDIVDKLIAEEEKAVNDYKEALNADSDLASNDIYAHILREELEHLEELKNLKETHTSHDSVRDSVEDKIEDILDKLDRLGIYY